MIEAIEVIEIQFQTIGLEFKVQESHPSPSNLYFSTLHRLYDSIKR